MNGGAHINKSAKLLYNYTVLTKELDETIVLPDVTGEFGPTVLPDVTGRSGAFDSAM